MFVCVWHDSPQWTRASSFTRLPDHTQGRATVGRTSLDEWSARRWDLYLTTHNTHNTQTYMRPVGFEPKISAGERPQSYALDRAPNSCTVFFLIGWRWTKYEIISFTLEVKFGNWPSISETVWISPTPNLTQICQWIRKMWEEIHWRSWVKYVCLLLLPIALRPLEFGLGFLYNWRPFFPIQSFSSPSFYTKFPYILLHIHSK